MRKIKIKTDNNRIRYFIYCRKSSEGEDRQALSIPAQIDEMMKLAKENNLEIVEILSEAKSAKEPGRKIFNAMLSRIYKGEAEGIICWELNRLARNPIDGGQITWLLQQGIIKHIATYGRNYYPSDNVLAMQVELGMANQYIRDLSAGVKRGIRKKAAMGYPNGVAKIGYLNDKSEEKGNRTWHDDPVRFPLIKMLFEKFLTGRYAVRQIWKMSKDELHLTTPQRKREGGKPVSLSYFYSILADPVYAGFFYHNSERYDLNKKLTRAITEDQYWQIQQMLGKNGRPQPQKREGLYNYFMRCGYCNGMTTPDFKFQLICSECKEKFSYTNREDCPKCHIKISEMKSPKYLHYVYYRCTNGKKCINPELAKKCTEQTQIENFIKEYSDKNLQMTKEFSQWCINNLENLPNNDYKIEAIDNAKQNLEGEIKKKLNKLLEERLRRDNLTSIEIEIFDSQEKRLLEELSSIQTEVKKEKASIERVDEIKKRFALMSEIGDILENGSNKDKKEALYILRSNLTLLAKKVDIININSISIYVDCINSIRSKNPSFEPKNIKDLSTKNEAFAPFIPALLPE